MILPRSLVPCTRWWPNRPFVFVMALSTWPGFVIPRYEGSSVVSNNAGFRRSLLRQDDKTGTIRRKKEQKKADVGQLKLEQSEMEKYTNLIV